MQLTLFFSWLEADLKSVDRSKTPWVVVGLHRYMYTTMAGESKRNAASAEYLRQYLEPLFFSYQVNVVLQGHQHSYERTCKLYQSQCSTNNMGPVYVTLGPMWSSFMYLFGLMVVVGTAGTDLETTGFLPDAKWSQMRIEAWYGGMSLILTST